MHRFTPLPYDLPHCLPPDALTEQMLGLFLKCTQQVLLCLHMSGAALRAGNLLVIHNIFHSSGRNRHPTMNNQVWLMFQWSPKA